MVIGMWIVFAFGSAIFAGGTSILAKCGIRRTDSNVATAVRTIVVLVFACTSSSARRRSKHQISVHLSCKR